MQTNVNNSEINGKIHDQLPDCESAHGNRDEDANADRDEGVLSNLKKINTL